MTIRVHSPGLFTTVQDLGRPGYGPLGVSPSGAADPIALRAGNLLVGNPPDAAALEMTLTGGTFEFPQGAAIALTGAACDARMWTRIEIADGKILRLGPLRDGARAYLCVRGGIQVPLFLGSASTHILSGLGGYQGRALKKGDVLPVGAPPTSAGTPLRQLDKIARLSFRKLLRVTAGPQAAAFSDAALATFYSSPYQLTEECNRMGLRLQGPAIESPHGGQMLTEGVSLGAIQTPASGQPIILFVEQQTTGGYPKIANVISADLPAIGQLRPRDEIRFELVDPARAVHLLREQEMLFS